MSYRIWLTNEEEELEAGLDDASQVEPAHDAQQKAGYDLGPDQDDVGRHLLPPLDGRLALAEGFGAVEDDDTQRQPPYYGRRIHVNLIGEVGLVVVRDEEARHGAGDVGGVCWSIKLCPEQTPKE